MSSTHTIPPGGSSPCCVQGVSVLFGCFLLGSGVWRPPTLALAKYVASLKMVKWRRAEGISRRDVVAFKSGLFAHLFVV